MLAMWEGTLPATKLKQVSESAHADDATATSEKWLSHIDTEVRADALSLTHADGRVRVSFRVVMDSLRLGRNEQLYVTPRLDGDGHDVWLPALLISGRNMHYAYQRGSVRADRDLVGEIRRENGKPQAYEYTYSLEDAPWMAPEKLSLSLFTDQSGCGCKPEDEQLLALLEPQTPEAINYASLMAATYLTPAVTELPINIHEGRARVQFEVDRTELHAQPYRTKNGRLIDNRAALQVIDDSVQYALSNPNVEIAEIEVIGYASPESPYVHNRDLASGRSAALAQWLARQYNLAAPRFDFVAENWAEFDSIVRKATDIIEQQRADLLELIEAPAFTPADYDAKEQTLKTDRRYASLYKSKILPEWFPLLRATTFRIKTRLKPLSDEQMAAIVDRDYRLMSLNQLFRVARLYPEGSDDFNRIIMLALANEPENPEANTNAAVAAIARGDYEAAARYAEKAGTSPEAENVRGILAANDGDLAAARRHFEAASPLPAASKNLALLP